MYAFRCTEQQLNDQLERITDAGDTLLQAVYKGGRDWMLICRKAEVLRAPTVVPRDPDYVERDPVPPAPPHRPPPLPNPVHTR